jgi:hypothetical protein
MASSSLRTGLLTVTVLLGMLVFFACVFFYLLASPQTWSSTHPQQSDVSVRVEVHKLGFRDDHDQTEVYLCHSPWLDLNEEKMVARFDSNGGYDGPGPYGAKFHL